VGDKGDGTGAADREFNGATFNAAHGEGAARAKKVATTAEAVFDWFAGSPTAESLDGR